MPRKNNDTITKQNTKAQAQAQAQAEAQAEADVESKQNNEGKQNTKSKQNNKPKQNAKISRTKNTKTNNKQKNKKEKDDESDNYSEEAEEEEAEEEETSENKYNNNYDATKHTGGEGDTQYDDVNRDEDEALNDEVEVDADEAGDEEEAEDGEEEEEEEAPDEGEIAETAEKSGVEADDDCAYNVTRKTRGRLKKIGTVIDKEDDDDDTSEFINADESEVTSDLYVKPEDRRSCPNLTQYERVRLLGDRTAQLAQGAKPMIKGVQGMNPRVIAQLELESKMIPINIIRPMTNGKKEKWALSELSLKKKYIVYGFTGGTVDKEAVEKINYEYKKGGSIIGYSHLTDTIKTIKKE
jgi:DNA-directed RNA polymerase subunit K/omega